jgi:hypothetical protein
MSYPHSRSQKTGRGRRACSIIAGTVAAAAIGAGLAGTAQAATPTAQLSFSPSTVSAGTQPQLTFLSQGAPAGSLLYLEESPNGGQQWKTVDKTTSTQGTANIAALPEGVYEFRIVITDENTTLGTSAPATLTVTGLGGAQPSGAPTPTAAVPSATASATAAPSGSGASWLDIIVKPVWESIVAAVVTFFLSLL